MLCYTKNTLKQEIIWRRIGYNMNVRSDIRNIAIIAHVDHGKTTLVDQLLRYSGTFREHEELGTRMLDSGDLERERGITILAKNTAIKYKDTKINILDTPGHADFGGEVERIMKMVDGVILVVDAYEGTMPQTRFVLKKALEAALKPIVVLNKIDRPNARPDEVIDQVYDLFIDLGADDDQLEFPVLYTSALQGTSGYEPDAQQQSMDPLFETIVRTVPAPEDTSAEPLQLQITLLDYNEYVGRIGIGKVHRGEIKVGDQVVVLKQDGTQQSFRVTKLFGFLGLERLEIKEAKAGDIVAVAGMDKLSIGDTICLQTHPEALPPIHIDEPTLQMTFLVNNSPFAGKEGKYVTAKKIEERLFTQLETDVSLRVEKTASPDKWIVSGRGELHLAILIESMRREGYELQISNPQVIYKEIDGVLCEPFERVQIDIPEEYTGTIMEALGKRKGELINMEQMDNNQVRLLFKVPSRGLLGYRTEFMSQTRGYGIMHHTFYRYEPVIKGDIGRRRQGVLVSLDSGKATTYGILHLEDRGTIFVEPGTEVYGGMIVGEHNRENDLTVNITREKHLTNIRSAHKEQTAVIRKTMQMSLEEAIQYINDDEYCEVTPESIRLRKILLDKSERERAARKKKRAEDN